MSRRRAFDMSSAAPSARNTRRGADNALDVETNFRRLAAQLGLSRQLQHITDDDAVDDDGDHSQRFEEDAADDADEYDDEFANDDRPADSPLTPLRSDYSASESLSSDLSLPRSFGNYDMMRTRKPPFDDELHRRTQLNTERNASAIAVSASGGGGGGGGGDMMRKFYEAQVVKIRSQVAVLTQAQRQVETMLHEERQQWVRKRDELEKALADERVASERESSRLQSELQQCRQRLKMEKAHLSDLQISDALAEQLSRQDEDDLTVKEFVQLQVHRKLRHVESELSQARNEIERLQIVCSNYKSHATTSSDEASQLVRAAEARELRLQHELEQSEASCVELERQVTSLCGQLDVFKEAHAKRENENTKKPANVDVYTENEKLMSELELASERLRVNAEKSDDLRKQVDDLHQEVALLSADKSFLQDAKRQLEDHEMRLMAKNKELQSKADLAAAAQLAGSNELHNVQDETRLAFEKQLAGEIDKFMEMSKREIDTIRGNSQMVYERENRLLKEARDDALKQIDMLQTKLQSVQASLEEKVLESTRLESTHSSTLASIRNDLKMKTFEMNQLGLTLEERSSELRSARLELDMLLQKVEVHREEFARLESMSTMRISQLEASLEIERKRLEEYERLEVDLDEAILQTGAVGHTEKELRGKEASGNQNLDEVMATFQAIPTSTKRRFHQSVQLAQRVVKYQKQSIELERQLEMCSSDKRQLSNEIAGLKRQLANFHQPQSYLIDKLGRKDVELQKLHETNKQLQNQLTSVRAEYQQANAAKMALQAQLQQVLAGREELHGLKLTVQALRKKLDAGDDRPVPPTPPQKPQPSPVMLKHSPSPHVLSQMLRPPTPQSNSAHGSPTSADPPPKWYIKLRS